MFTNSNTPIAILFAIGTYFPAIIDGMYAIAFAPLAIPIPDTNETPIKAMAYVIATTSGVNCLIFIIYLFVSIHSPFDRW